MPVLLFYKQLTGLLQSKFWLVVPYTKIDRDILSPPYILNLPPLRMIVRYFATQNDSSQKQNYFYATSLYDFEASGLCCYLLNNLQISYDHNFG